MSKWQQRRLHSSDDDFHVVNKLNAGLLNQGMAAQMHIWLSRRSIHELKKIPFSFILFDTAMRARPASLLDGR
jgi:hypothetical protein